MIPSGLPHPHPCPNAARDESPKEHEQIIPPINNLYPLALFNGPHDVSRHILGIKLQGIAAAGNEVGLHKAGTYIGDGDIEMAHPCLLT